MRLAATRSAMAAGSTGPPERGAAPDDDVFMGFGPLARAERSGTYRISATPTKGLEKNRRRAEVEQGRGTIRAVRRTNGKARVFLLRASSSSVHPGHGDGGRAARAVTQRCGRVACLYRYRALTSSTQPLRFRC